MRKYLRPQVLLGLFVLGGLVGGTAFSSSDGNTISESEAAEMDAQSYADDFGVSLDVAKERLAEQVRIGEAIKEVRDAESETFAGAWVEHTPQWRVVVKTTDSGPSAEAVGEYFSDTSISVTLKRDALWSEQVTLRNLQDIEAALEDIVDEYILAVNPQEPKGVVVSLRIPEDLVGSTPEELAQRIPTVVNDKSASVGWRDGRLVRNHAVYGGAELQHRGTNQRACTSGFAVENSSGTTGLVSSGHCPASMDYRAPDGTEYAMTVRQRVDNSQGDFGWWTTTQTEDNRIYQNSSNVRRTITSYEDDYDDLFVGQYLCLHGRTTGYGCDTIEYLNYAGLPDPSVIMENGRTAGGDSGGPWFHANRAYGVHKGGAFIGGEWLDLWMAVAFLEDVLDIEVLTD